MIDCCLLNLVDTDAFFPLFILFGRVYFWSAQFGVCFINFVVLIKLACLKMVLVQNPDSWPKQIKGKTKFARRLIAEQLYLILCISSKYNRYSAEIKHNISLHQLNYQNTVADKTKRLIKKERCPSKLFLRMNSSMLGIEHGILGFKSHTSYHYISSRG